MLAFPIKTHFRPVLLINRKLPQRYIPCHGHRRRSRDRSPEVFPPNPCTPNASSIHVYSVRTEQGHKRQDSPVAEGTTPTGRGIGFESLFLFPADSRRYTFFGKELREYSSRALVTYSRLPPTGINVPRNKPRRIPLPLELFNLELMIAA